MKGLQGQERAPKQQMDKDSAIRSRIMVQTMFLKIL